MKRFIIALLLALLAAPASASAPAYAEGAPKESAFDRVMRVGTLRCGFIAWPPGFEIDANTKEVRGPTKELFESIVKLTGWKVEFVEEQLTNYVLDLNNGHIDAMCADGPWTLTSVRLVDYTTPAIYTPIMLYVRADEARFKTAPDLNTDKASLVGIDGDVSSDLAALRFPKSKLRTLVNTTDPASMMLEVSTGKADAVILDPVTAEKFMTANPGKMKQLGGALAVYPVGMSVKRGEAALQQTLSRATEMAQNIGLADSKVDLYDATRKTIYSTAKSYEAPK